jgi:predicted RNA binding protein YcfA (HicA-like mRNA interferase family)
MTDVPALSFSQLINMVQRLGFVRVRRKTTIADHGHRSVPKGLLAKIIRYDLEMTTEEFLRVLR